MRLRGIFLIIAVIILLGVGAGFIANLYFSKHPILISDGENVYNILCDVVLILITVLTILTAAFAAIIGWTLQNTLMRDIRARISTHLKDTENILLSTLHGRVAPLWGRLYEYDRKSPQLINYSIDQAEKAVDYVRKVDDKTHWELRGMALNNYIMALTEKGDVGDTNLVYKIGSELEEVLKKHKNEMTLHDLQSTEETIYFSRYVLPRKGSKDQEEAKRDFEKLKEHPLFEKWKKKME